MHHSNEPPMTDQLPLQLQLVFAPLHKRAFGMAAGVACGSLVAAATIVHLLRAPDDPFPLSLLNQYFYGYSVSWWGVFVGAFWMGLAAFVFGWFLAFTRNLVIAVMLFIGRTRAELAETRDFLDHI